MTAKQIVDNPVPRPGDGGSLQGLHLGQSSTACLKQIAESPDPGGGLQFSTSPEFRSVFFGFSWTRWARGFSDFSPGQKKSEGRPPGG